MLKNLHLPIISLCLLTLGNSLFTTVASIHLEYNHVPLTQIGLINSTFFIGQLLGSIVTKQIIRQIGFVRSFILFALTIAASALGYWLTDVVIGWFFLRFITGAATVGLFIVIESWLMIESNVNNRVKVLAYYHTLWSVPIKLDTELS